MYVEDLLIKIRDKLTIDIPQFPSQVRISRGRAFNGLLDEWSHDFILSVSKHVTEGRALSTKQAEIVLKIIGKLQSPLVDYGWLRDPDLTSMLAEPQYKLPLYESIHIPKEVRYLGDNLLAFRCKTNGDLSMAIKNLGHPQSTPWLHRLHLSSHERARQTIVATNVRYDWYHKIWVVPVYRFNLKAITDLMATHRLKPDDITVEYLKAARRAFDKPAEVSVCDEHEAILVHVPDDPLLAGWLTEVAEGVAI